MTDANLIIANVGNEYTFAGHIKSDLPSDDPDQTSTKNCTIIDLTFCTAGIRNYLKD